MHKRNFHWRVAAMALALLFTWGIFAAPRTAATAARPGQIRAAATGRIVGTVFFHGPKPRLRPIRMDKVCASLHIGPVYPQNGRVNANGTLPDAFVYVEQSSAALPSKPPTTPAVLRQKGCEFVPPVVGVMVGQPFEVQNLDPTTHNIEILAKINRQVNVTQLPGAPPLVRWFRHPEAMIPIRCNIHPWMKASLAVLNNPFYAVTGPKGKFTLKGLPPGHYKIKVWTAAFGTRLRSITLRAGQTATANFTFERQ